MFKKIIDAKKINDVKVNIYRYNPSIEIHLIAFKTLSPYRKQS
jgi:hypothetical protein